VQITGLEPARVAPLEPESSASAYSAISANQQHPYYNRRIKKNQAFLEKKLIKFKIILSYTKNICVNKRFFSSFALDIFGIMRYNIIKSVNCKD
jgi:hypothetical protein